MNCKAEFLEEIGERKLLCAIIDCYKTDDKKIALLKVGYSLDDLAFFLECLDFEYDDGLEGQNLFGTIWYQDGTWSDRAEYDGSEWWVYRACPKIPSALQLSRRQ